MKSIIIAFATLILALPSTAYGQRSSSLTDTCRARVLSCKAQKEILQRINDGIYFTNQYKRMQKDSAVLAAMVDKTDQLNAELQFQVNVAQVVLDDVNQQMANMKADNDNLKADNVKIERKYQRQKRLKWVFGAGGFILGFAAVLL